MLLLKGKNSAEGVLYLPVASSIIIELKSDSQWTVKYSHAYKLIDIIVSKSLLGRKCMLDLIIEDI